MKLKLDHPCVGDLVKALQQLEQGAPVRILDPDTGWTVVELEVFDGQQPRPEIVWLTGNYAEMTSSVE